jgi:ABC-2 type transport system ATP-binding protein
VASPAIEVRDLHKAYGSVEAVRGVSFEVEQGEVFGLLGPNGAGKTTTVEILEGYRRRSAGHVSVLGHDPAERDRELQQRVGIVLQSCGFYPRVTVNEAVEHFAKAYARPRDPGETIRLVGLGEKADARTKELSGGQRRRLDLALALVGDPELVFLDEPTTGFDPAARRTAWGVVRTLKELGKTVLLTTHYLDEAQELADRVAVIAAGEIVAAGTPADLGGRADATARISFRLPVTVPASELPLKPDELRRDAEGQAVVLQADDPVAPLARLTAWSLERAIPLAGLEVRRPSLEDVYLELTADDGAAGGEGG